MVVKVSTAAAAATAAATIVASLMVDFPLIDSIVRRDLRAHSPLSHWSASFSFSTDWCSLSSLYDLTDNKVENEWAREREMQRKVVSRS